jgi:hypothetical protein
MDGKAAVLFTLLQAVSGEGLECRHRQRDVLDGAVGKLGPMLRLLFSADFWPIFGGKIGVRL